MLNRLHQAIQTDWDTTLFIAGCALFLMTAYTAQTQSHIQVQSQSTHTIPAQWLADNRQLITPTASQQLTQRFRQGSIQNPTNIASGGNHPQAQSAKRSASTRKYRKKAKPPMTPFNLNTATISQLKTLPGIGPKLAQRIITYKTQNGPFTAIQQLTQVKGIGSKSLQKIKPYLQL